MQRAIIIPLAVVVLLAGCAARDACSAGVRPDQVAGLVVEPRGLTAPEAASYEVDRGEGVTDAEVALILGGLAMGESTIQSLGGRALDASRNGMVVHLVATGKGAEEYGGACCIGSWAPPGGRYGPFFDLGQMRGPPTGAWPRDVETQKVAAHEFTHWWQGATQCQSERAQLTGWMSEGMAEFVAYESLVAGGRATREQVHAFMLSAARNTGALAAPIEKLGTPEGRHHPGHVGFLAFEHLAATTSREAVIDLCERMADGAATEAAFEATFGETLAAFHARWPGVAAAMC